MFIRDLYKIKKPVVSFETFPPKKQSAVEAVTSTLGQIAALRPDFISVTYGAGGSGNSGKTTEIASMIKHECGIEPLAHLTAITAKRESIHRTLEDLRAHDVHNIMALRGDVPAGFEGDPNGDFVHACDLIREIREAGGFCVGAACYPEGHIDCDSLPNNYAHLVQKQEAGADFLITQLFFDNDQFYRFLERARRAGVTIPIVPGIMPMMSKSQVERMIFTCGVSLPSRIIRILHRYENDPASLEQAGIDYACEQAADLLNQEVDGIHIYTMNKPQVASACKSRIDFLLK